LRTCTSQRDLLRDIVVLFNIVQKQGTDYLSEFLCGLLSALRSPPLRAKASLIGFERIFISDTLLNVEGWSWLNSTNSVLREIQKAPVWKLQ